MSTENRSRSRQRAIALCCFAFEFLVLAFPWGSALSKASFAIADSNVWASGKTPLAPVWIDSQRVLFITGSHLQANEDTRSLAIWDLYGKSQIYKENVDEFCFRDGKLTYKVVRAKGPRSQGTWFSGRLGEEKPIRSDYEGDVARLRDPLNCRVVSDKEVITAKVDRKTLTLVDGHGHLDLGPMRGDESVRNTLINYVGSGTLISMPFGRFDFVFSGFYPFAGRYLFRDLGYGKRKGVATSRSAIKGHRLAWSLGVNGRLEEHLVPDGPWTGGPVPEPFLTSMGLGFVNHGGIRDRTDGLYLVTDKDAVRVIGGRVNKVGVSLDGCRLAFSHAPTVEVDRAFGQVRRTLKMIDVCVEKNK